MRFLLVLPLMHCAWVAGLEDGILRVEDGGATLLSGEDASYVTLPDGRVEEVVRDSGAPPDGSATYCSGLPDPKPALCVDFDRGSFTSVLAFGKAETWGSEIVGNARAELDRGVFVSGPSSLALRASPATDDAPASASFAHPIGGAFNAARTDVVLSVDELQGSSKPVELLGYRFTSGSEPYGIVMGVTSNMTLVLIETGYNVSAGGTVVYPSSLALRKGELCQVRARASIARVAPVTLLVELQTSSCSGAGKWSTFVRPPFLSAPRMWLGLFAKSAGTVSAHFDNVVLSLQ